MPSWETKLTLLHDYFAKDPDILLAFLFGSVAKGQETTESDVDIGIYFKPSGRALEWEEETDYPRENEIWSEIEKIVGRRTDLVILNRAPATLVYSILEEGQPIIIKDVPLYWRLFLLISSVAEDFRAFTTDFWTIKQRSASLNEIDKNRLIKLIDFLDSELGDYSKFKNLDQWSYESEASVRRNLERWAENIVNASIDVAKIILASEKKKIPQTYRGILEELALIDGFDSVLATKLSQFTKLRNILAHEYLDLRFQQLKKFVDESEPLYRGLVDFTKKF